MYFPGSSAFSCVAVAVGVRTSPAAPALKSATLQQTAECVSYGHSSWNFAAVCCSTTAPMPSDPRHTHTPMPACDVPARVTVMALALDDPATANASCEEHVFSAVLDARDVNVSPVAVGRASVTALSLSAITTITSPVCHETDAETIEPDVPELYGTSVYEMNVGAVTRATRAFSVRRRVRSVTV